MSQASFDSDLFQPSLTERDDATGFDRPWNPMTLAVLTFFFGLPAGGGLLALNFRRLGMPSWALPTGLTVAVVWLTGYSALIWYSMLEKPPEGERWWLGVGFRTACIVFSLALVRMQRRRYRLLEMVDAPKGKLLWPAVIACVLSQLVTYALPFAVALVMALQERN